MNVLSVYARLYAGCLGRALTTLRKNAWTLLLPMGLFLVFEFLGHQISRFGVLGGIAVALLLAAIASCYLYFTGEVVGNARVRFSEFGRSIGAYFWSVTNVLFVVWIIQLILGLLVRSAPQGATVAQAVIWLGVILLNAVPEVVYLRGTYGGLATIERAVKFLQANWIEWFIPNGLVLAAIYLSPLEQFDFAWTGSGRLVLGVLKGALFHLVMVFRGYLFQALDGTSHRQRMYRYRAGASAG